MLCLWNKYNQLYSYFGWLKQRFFSDEIAAESVKIDLKPKSGRGTDIEQPLPNNRSFRIYQIEGIIAATLELIPTRNVYEMKLYLNLVKIYTMASKLDCQQFLGKLFECWITFSLLYCYLRFFSD